MSDSDTQEVNAPTRDLQLDPFAFHPGVASRITGLGGGNAPGHDRTYVFHTAYVEAAPGASQFTVRFSGLRARQGTLLLRVHMLSLEEGSHAILANSVRVQLNRLVQQGGSATVDFEGFRGFSFALYGSLPGDAEVEAEAVTITLDRPASGVEMPEIVVDARTSAFGRESVRPATHLISTERATLAHPVSQICTARQLRERTFRDWAGRLELDGRDDAECWSAAYVMQVLSQFGMLAPGSYGAGIGIDGSPLAAAIAGSGSRLLAIRHARDGQDEPDASAFLEGLRRPRLCDDAALAERIEVRQVDLARMPNDIVNFDFVWSCGVADTRGTLADGMVFIENMIARLRPGGIAVHTMAFNLSSIEQTIDRGPRVLFRRRDLERISLVQISRNNEAAQIKIDVENAPPLAYPAVQGAPDYEATMCGIIIRKAATVV